MVKQPIDKPGSLSSELAKLAPFRLFPQPVTEEQRKLRDLEIALDDAIHANMAFFISRRKDRI